VRRAEYRRGHLDGRALLFTVHLVFIFQRQRKKFFTRLLHTVIVICFVSCLLNLIVTLCFDHVPFSRCMSRGPFSLNMNPRQHALVRWAGDAPVEASKDRGRSIALWLFYDFNKIMIGSFGVINEDKFRDL